MYFSTLNFLLSTFLLINNNNDSFSLAQTTNTGFEGNSFKEFFSYNLQMTPADLQFLNNNPRLEQYVQCTVTIYKGGEITDANKVLTRTGAGCRYKGGVGSFQGCVDEITGKKIESDWCRNLPWKVNAGKFAPKPDTQGKFDGRDKLVFQSIQADDSMMGEQVAWHAMNDIGGTPACRLNSANVYVNGEYQGLYNNIEQIDDDFVDHRWGKTVRKQGALTKHVWFQDWIGDPAMKIEFTAKSGFNGTGIMGAIREKAEDCHQRRKLCTIAEAQSILENVDKMSFINAFVIANIMGNYDTPPFVYFFENDYTVNNFYFFIEELTGKITFIPWDYTESLKFPVCNPGFCEVPQFGQYEFFDEAPSFAPNDVNLCRSKNSLYKNEPLYLAAPACEPMLYVMSKAWGEDYRIAFKKYVTNGFQNKEQVFQDNLAVEQKPWVEKFAKQGGLPAVSDWEKDKLLKRGRAFDTGTALVELNGFVDIPVVTTSTTQPSTSTSTSTSTNTNTDTPSDPDNNGEENGNANPGTGERLVFSMLVHLCLLCFFLIN